MIQNADTRLDGNRLVRAHPHAVPAARRPQARRSAGRERAYLELEAAAGWNADQGAGARVAVAANLDEGVCSTVSEIGDAENISKSYVSRILRLALWAPDMIEAIVAGRADQSLILERLERPLPSS